MPASNADPLDSAQSDLVARLPASHQAFEAGVYVHWPFCERKCPYCDFNSHVREQVDQKAWRDAMLTEIDTFEASFPNLRAKSIFFGGGTPSLMPPETTAAIIERIRTNWQPDGEIEITLEANPSSIEAGRFRGYADAGVNRISIGVQSLKDSSLKFLGRLHSAGEAIKALDVARNNFERVSFDLIYALPDQSPEDWHAELQQALDFSPSHLSLYQLTIEEGTAFYHQYRRGKFTLPDEDIAALMFALTQDVTNTASLPAYEISNHARPGEESQHNLVYWRGQPYVGIGPGAHGRLPGDKTTGKGSATAHAQIKRPEEWLRTVMSSGHGTSTLDMISANERAVEAIMMGLRLSDGIQKRAFEAQFGTSIDDYLDHDAINSLAQSGHIENSSSRLCTTHTGKPVLNYILQKLIA